MSKFMVHSFRHKNWRIRQEVWRTKFKVETQSSKFKTGVQSAKFLVLSFGFALCVLHFTLNALFAQSISSTELINNAKQYDGKNVIYSGEVIGDIMKRGKSAWINVHDGKTAIGIWLDSGLLSEIQYAGDYNTKGDWIEIDGIFHRACSLHGGEMDIHALKIRKIIAGSPIKRELDITKNNLAITLLGALFIVWILAFLKRR